MWHPVFFVQNKVAIEQTVIAEIKAREKKISLLKVVCLNRDKWAMAVKNSANEEMRFVFQSSRAIFDLVR